MAREYLSQISVRQIPIARTVTVLAALVVPTGLPGGFFPSNLRNYCF